MWYCIKSCEYFIPVPEKSQCITGSCVSVGDIKASSPTAAGNVEADQTTTLERYYQPPRPAKLSFFIHNLCL